MNKTSVFSAALLCAAGLCGGQTTPAPAPTPAAGQSGPSPSMANGIGMQLSTGTVVEYKPGERIAVRVSDREVVTLDLDRNVRVDGAVAEGQLAAVLWTGDGGGVRRVNSITAAPGPGEAGTANLASSYREMSEPTRGSKAGSSPGSGPNNIAPPAGSTTPRATSSLGAPTPTPTP